MRRAGVSSALAPVGSTAGKTRPREQATDNSEADDGLDWVIAGSHGQKSSHPDVSFKTSVQREEQ